MVSLGAVNAVTVIFQLEHFAKDLPLLIAI